MNTDRQISEEELRKFIAGDFADHIVQTYKKALENPSLSDMEKNSGYMLVKAVLQAGAVDYHPMSAEGRELVKKLQQRH